MNKPYATPSAGSDAKGLEETPVLDRSWKAAGGTQDAGDRPPRDSRVVDPTRVAHGAV